MSYVPGGGIISFEPQEISTATRNMSAGQTTVVNVTESGILIGAIVEVTASLSAGGYGARLKFTVDGGTPTYIVVVSGIDFETWMTALPGSGDGTTVGDKRFIPLGFTYKTSLKVEADCTAGGGIGEIRVTVLRAKKV